MKKKIVEYIAGEASFRMAKAEGEIANMMHKYIDLRITTKDGLGLDFSVMQEHFAEAHKLIRLLTKQEQTK